jgi:hypothetical protein
MADKNRNQPLQPAKPKALVYLFLVSVIMAGVYAYYIYNVWITLAATALSLGIFVFYLEKPEYASSEELQNNLYKIMAFITVVFTLVRFYRLFSYPVDYQGDEWSDIVETYYKMKGDRSVFDNSGRNGAAFCFSSQLLVSLCMTIFKGWIESIRLISVFMYAAGLAAAYYFGKAVIDKKFGAVVAFVYASSGWTLFISRSKYCNNYDVVLLLLFLALFFDFIKKGGIWKLYALGAILVAGLFTYTAWLLMVPYVLYLVFEYRKELKKDGITVVLVAAGILTALSVFMFAVYSRTGEWISKLTVANAAGQDNIIIRTIMNLRHITEFYLLPLTTDATFTDKMPLLSYAEYFLLAGGFIVLIMNYKHKLYRTILAGFLLMHATLIISRSTDHHMRHIMLLPFVVIISSVFLSKLLKWKYAYLIIMLECLFFINSSFFMFTDWTYQFDVFTTDKIMANYINNTYKDSDYLFMHQTVPYGNYPCFLRTKAAFETTSPERIKRVIFIMPSLYRNFVKAVFPGVRTKYFYDYDGARKFTMVLFDVDVSNNPQLKKYFMDMETAMRDATIDLWRLDYKTCAAKCNGALMDSGGNLYKVFYNTVLKITLFEAYGRISGNRDTFKALNDTVKRSFISPEWFVIFANNQLREKSYAKAMEYYRKAYSMAPEWWQLKQSIDRINAQLLEMNIRL